MKLRSVFPLLKETFSEWSDDKAPKLAAALAYYTIFSLAPMLVITIAIVGFVYGQEAARGGIEQQIKELVGDKGAAAVQEMIANAGNRTSGILATLFGTVALLVGATGVFNELRDDLNIIWGVQQKPGSSALGFAKDRLVSLGMVLGVGFVLLVSLALSAAVSAMASRFTSVLPGAHFLAYIADFVLSLGVVTLLFAALYKYVPDAEIEWRDVWIGAGLTAFLFAIGKFLIGLYLGSSGMASAYGAAGALVLVLVWVYYSAQILFFGAEFTEVYARRHGSRLQPSGSTSRTERAGRLPDSAKPTRRHPAPTPERQRR